MKIAAVIVSLLLSVALPARGDEARFLKVSDKTEVAVAGLIDEAASADILFIGEAHDDAVQHRRQLEIIRALHDRKLPVAIGVEMFTADSQLYLDYWVQGKVTEKAFEPVYAANWSFDWSLYRDIFVFARDNHIPMIALNVSKPIVSKVVRGGSAALSDADRRGIPPGLSWILNSRQTGYLSKITAQVFGGRPSPLPSANFAEAQALRNGTFAWNIAKFREKSPKMKVVVIAGTWHAIRNGVPEEMRKYGNPASLVILPQLPEIDLKKATHEEADYFMLN